MKRIIYIFEWLVGIVAVAGVFLKRSWVYDRIKSVIRKWRQPDNKVELVHKNGSRREKELQQECVQAVNKYYDLQPEKSEAYKKRFLNELGIFDCMRHYRMSVAEDLDSMETLKDMNLLLEGNSLQFLRNAIQKLSEEYHWDNMNREEYLESLEKTFAEIFRKQDKEERVLELEEIYKKTEWMLQIETSNERRRTFLEKIETQLKSPEIEALMDFVKKPPKGCTEEEYDEKAHELDAAFGRMLDEYEKLKGGKQQ